VPSYIPKRVVDAHFRFSTYEDALTVGKEIFNGIQYRIVGSNDRPHWQSTPIENVIPEALSKRVWFVTAGVLQSKK
jgi:hypothetical protein